MMRLQSTVSIFPATVVYLGIDDTRANDMKHRRV